MHFCSFLDKAVLGDMTLAELEISLEDLNANWFLGSETDNR
jgi:hypothetical protein